ncbi:MAG: 30S ribosomal protein S16 [Gammaproteobacteria bacterium]|nr:30S ribosomal protein S16 [Gammaproteobacteria bacterium]
MVVIRLARAGAKKRPFYHLVVTDSRRRRDSNSIESVGYFNPIATGQEIRLHIDLEKVAYWKGVGAQLSDRVTALCKTFVANQKTQEKADAKKG